MERCKACLVAAGCDRRMRGAISHFHLPGGRGSARGCFQAQTAAWRERDHTGCFCYLECPPLSQPCRQRSELESERQFGAGRMTLLSRLPA